MNPDIAAHEPAVSAALRALERALAQLTTALAHEDVRVEVEGGGARERQRRAVVDAYAAIDYGTDDAVNETHDCLGVVGVPRAFLPLAARVNVAKDELKAVCAPLSGRRVRVPIRATGTSGGTQAIPLTRAILRSIERADLNLLAAYRHIPILERAPASIAYVRAQTRAVYRKSRRAVLDMLDRTDHPLASRDRASVAAVRDPWFALVREHAANVRANVVFVGLDRRGRGRVQVRAEVPLLFAMAARSDWPEIRFLESESGEMPVRSRVSQVEAAPWLAAFQIYRYKNYR